MPESSGDRPCLARCARLRLDETRSVFGELERFMSSCKHRNCRFGSVDCVWCACARTTNTCSSFLGSFYPNWTNDAQLLKSYDPSFAQLCSRQCCIPFSPVCNSPPLGPWSLFLTLLHMVRFHFFTTTTVFISKKIWGTLDIRGEIVLSAKTKICDW